MKAAKAQIDLIPTRRSLLSRLRDVGDQESWGDFFETYWRLIYQVALKARLNETEAEEVVQETVISVAKEMPSFRYDPARGKFKGWLLQITRRRIADLVRKRMQAAGISGQTPVETVSAEQLENVCDPAGGGLEAIWDEEWERHLFNTAVENIKKQVKPDHYQLFDLYVVQRWPVRKITQTLSVNAGQVYLAKHRVSQLLKKEINKLQRNEVKPL
jgi:RNA polymerase sigma-70 factor (ECF subfamily)